MKKTLGLAALLLVTCLTLTAQAQLQYFGYLGGADDDMSLRNTKAFTNFAAISTGSDLTDDFVRTRIAAMASNNIKALIDLGKVLWCDYTPNDPATDYVLCYDWQQRWATWRQNNAAVLTPDKVLAFAVRDEPFRWNVDGYLFDEVSQVVKSTFPWAKIYMPESACIPAGFCPSDTTDPAQLEHPPSYAQYHGSLPYVDWIGLDSYHIYPATDSNFRSERDAFKSRFPGKKWFYVVDGYWSGDHVEAGIAFGEMGQIARQWYDFARNDPDAVLLGVFVWQASREFPCPILADHVAIGRAVTGKVRSQTSSPIGSFSVDGAGVVSGWACDPDAAICEDPQIDFSVDGSYYTSSEFSYYSAPSNSYVNFQCGAGIATRFSRFLGTSTSGHRITAFARDLDSGGGSALPSACIENPACYWYTRYYQPKGYLEAISASGYATGWVCDPDAPQVASQVRLASSAGTIGYFTTSLSNEQAVSTECGGGTLHRFGVQLPTSTKGISIYAYAEDLGAPFTTAGEVVAPPLCGPCSW